MSAWVISQVGAGKSWSDGGGDVVLLSELAHHRKWHQLPLLRT